jgi:hypothetical protein
MKWTTRDYLGGLLMFIGLAGVAGHLLFNLFTAGAAPLFVGCVSLAVFIKGNKTQSE